MKQKDLIKKLKAGGFIFDRHGSNHDIYTTPKEIYQNQFHGTRKLMKDLLEVF